MPPSLLEEIEARVLRASGSDSRVSYIKAEIERISDEWEREGFLVRYNEMEDAIIVVPLTNGWLNNKILDELRLVSVYNDGVFYLYR